MDAFSKLPDELLLAIFLHVNHPNRLSRTNKRIHGIASNTLNIARWLEARYYKNETIYYALVHLGDRCQPVYEMLLQRTSQCPEYMLYNLILDGQQRPDMKVLVRSHGDIGETFVRMETVQQLDNAARLALAPRQAVGYPDLISPQARFDIAKAIRDYQAPNGASDGPVVAPVLLWNREAFVKALKTHGSPIYSRASAVDYAIVLLQKAHDVEWRLATLQRTIDFPSFDIWMFLRSVCVYYIGPLPPPSHLHQLRGEVGLPMNMHRHISQPDSRFNPVAAKYLFKQNEAGVYRYGYAILDSESSSPAFNLGTFSHNPSSEHWRAFLQAAGRAEVLKDMVTLLLCSYRGMRLLEETPKFEICYFKYVQVVHKSKRVRREGRRRHDPPPSNSLQSSFHDCPLFIRSQAEIDAFWLVLHLKNKISLAKGKEPDFIHARVTFDSIIYLLSYPWLSSTELAAALSLAGLKLSKEYNIQTVIKRALKKIMQNAFCGVHLVELCSKLELDNPVPFMERLVSSDTVDAILVYPEIDDRYSEDPLVAGLNGYKLDLPTRKPNYSDMGPKIHLPLALALLEVIHDRNSRALKLILARAVQKKLNKIVKAYNIAGVTE